LPKYAVEELGSIGMGAPTHQECASKTFRSTPEFQDVVGTFLQSAKDPWRTCPIDKDGSNCYRKIPNDERDDTILLEIYESKAKK
jgi:hypothetical protein